jgi:hypothetical protein
MIRWFYSILLLMLSVVPSSVQAQAIDPCFGLAVEDCTIIGDASANTFANLSAFNFTFSLDFAVSGLEALGLGQDTALTVAGSGSFIRQADDGTVPASVQLDLTAALMTSAGTVDGTLAARLMDDQVYLQVDGSEWRGIALETLLESSLFSAASLTQVPFGSSGQTSDFNLADTLSGVAALLDTPGFITYARLEDENEGGQARAPFSFSLDFTPLFASEVFRQQLDQALALAGTLDPSLESTALIAPLLLEDSTLNISLTQWVNAESSLIDRLALMVDGSLDLNTVLGTTEANRVAPITLRVDFQVSLSDVNTALDITVPDSFTEITLAELGLE